MLATDSESCDNVSDGEGTSDGKCKNFPEIKYPFEEKHSLLKVVGGVKRTPDQ